VPPSHPSTDRPRDLLVAGHLNVDRFLRVARFPAADRTVPVIASRSELGGTAALIALSAARRGVAVGMVSRIGPDFPPAFTERLRNARIDLRGVERVPGGSTPTCYIVEDRRGGQRTLIDQGPMGDARDAARPGAWLREYAWIHLGTGDPTYQLALARAARRAGLRVAVDPAQEIFYRWAPRPFARLLGAAELLFGNAAEIDRAADLARVRGVTGLLERVPMIVRTEGRKGATAFSRAGPVHVPAARVGSVRTVVGAGDAFRGGFYAAWFEGVALVGCLRAGVRAAASRIAGRE
jgi:sugar/nucleoside kinase (ribokinase family)